jgi:exopolyphosphatase/guanosine-5'-triphosphate,3'-diphosphate pyrophosphatase
MFFFQTANKILPKNIKLLSGEQEAQTIYAGVLHTSAVKKHSNITKKLVVDIGGASTEIIVGEGKKSKRTSEFRYRLRQFFKPLLRRWIINSY